MDVNDYIFRKRSGETLVKPPGSINGNGFVLDTLHDCEVYLLDHSSQVQVDDCINCKIFIGPTDGSVFLRDCRDCTICVASQQLRTRDCKDLDIALYCATQPSIETSTGIVFSCWQGAYPGLSEHFQQARLDPTKNTWRQVYDFNRMEDLGAEHFRLDDSVRPWWTAPSEGLEGPPDCPVPAADGSLYGGGHVPLEQSPPKPPPGALNLPSSLPPSPGRAAAYDEEVELDDDEPVTILPPGVDDGGQSFVAPAQPSPRGDTSLPPPPPPPQAPNPAFTFDSPRTASAGGAGVVAGAGATLLGRSSNSGGGDDAGAAGAAFLGSGDDNDDPFGAFLESQAPAAAPPPAGDFGGSDTFVAAADPRVAAPGAEAAAVPVPQPAPEPNVDARVAWRVANAKQLARRAAEESQERDAVQAEARRKLEAVQQTRAARLKQRFATNRAATEKPAAAAAAAAAASSGAAGWERVAELVGLAGGGGGGAAAAGKVVRPGAAPSKDVTRLRQLIITLKTKRK